MQENRDWCLLMQFVHKDDGTYVLGECARRHLLSTVVFEALGLEP